MNLLHFSTISLDFLLHAVHNNLYYFLGKFLDVFNEFSVYVFEHLLWFEIVYCTDHNQTGLPHEYWECAFLCFYHHGILFCILGKSIWCLYELFWHDQTNANENQTVHYTLYSQVTNPNELLWRALLIGFWYRIASHMFHTSLEPFHAPARCAVSSYILP